MTIIDIALTALLTYLAIGLPVGVAFVTRGVERIDPVAVGSPVRFRLLILPGSVALWPVMLGKWRRAVRPASGAAP